MKSDNTWTNPQNLGPDINTDQIEDGENIHNGKYFFFNRRKAWIADEDSDIYWVDSRIVFKPYIETPIRDVGAVENKEFQFKIPPETFKDYDDNTLNYSASLSNGNPLPAWLIFNSADLIFSGKPVQYTTIFIKVTATDKIGSSISDEFAIYINQDKAMNPYLGEECPGMEPKIFAPGIVSIPGRLDRVVAFSTDGKEIFFSTYNAGWSNAKIMHIKEVNGEWTNPKIASFSKGL